MAKIILDEFGVTETETFEVDEDSTIIPTEDVTILNIKIMDTKETTIGISTVSKSNLQPSGVAGSWILYAVD